MVDELPLVIDRRDGTPLAVQLADALRAAAQRGMVRPGDRIPSTRALASTLGVSRTVTSAAYDMLHAEGWLSGRRGAGTFVTGVPGAPPRARPARPARPAAPDAHVVDLRSGRPWVAGLSAQAWRRAWRAAADRPPLSRPEHAGLPEFREAVAEHLLRHRGLGVPAGEVLATAGTTAALVELVAGALRPGETVAIEDPGYPRGAAALRAAGLDVVAVPTDEGGLVVDALPPHVRAVYCTPAHQYPMGAGMPAQRRLRLVSWARAHGAWIVEDDYDGELRHDGPPLPMLASLGPDVVVHLGTTSKILTPTLGAGWMVAPPDLASVVLQRREIAGVAPAAAGQRVLAALASTGDLARHLRRLRRQMLARRDLIAGALRTAGLPIVGERTGAHLVVVSPDTEHERAALRAAEARGVLLDGVERCRQGDNARSGVVLGYSGPDSIDVIAATLPTLIAALARPS